MVESKGPAAEALVGAVTLNSTTVRRQVRILLSTAWYTSLIGEQSGNQPLHPAAAWRGGTNVISRPQRKPFGASSSIQPPLATNLTISAQCTSRHLCLQSPRWMCTKCALTRSCAVVKPDPSALVVCEIWTADDTLPVVEVLGVAESRQAHIEFKH